MRVVVLGAGVAGLSAGLALARGGHDVAILERDVAAAGEPTAAFDWDRGGVPHFQAPHAFLPRGRKELRERFPDVYGALIDAGAAEADLRENLPEDRRPDDDELVFLSVRRPLIEWALRTAVLREPSARIESGLAADGLLGEHGPVPCVTGVRTASGDLEADLVVDASGRRTKAGQWVEQLGGTAPDVEETPCHVTYYMRYYRLARPTPPPKGRWFPSPRGDLGYAAFASFPGDNGTVGTVISVHPNDREIRGVRDPRAYEAAITAMTPLAAWLEAGEAEPITDVMAMAGLRNRFQRVRTEGDLRVRGLVAAGDALCHTDPVGALGLSFSVAHASALADSFARHEQVDEAVSAFYDTAVPEAEERFTLMSELDEARGRMWSGERVDFTRRDGGAYALFSVTGALAAGFEDPEVFRIAVRRWALLDRTTLFDENAEVQQRVERILAAMMSAGPPPRPGPGRDELLAIIERATA